MNSGWLKYVCHDHLPSHKPLMYWSISLVELNTKFCKSDQPGLLLVDSDVANNKTTFCIRMVHTNNWWFVWLICCENNYLLIITLYLFPLNDLGQLADHYCHWFLKEGKFLYGTVSNPQDCSKALYTFLELYFYINPLQITHLPLCGILYFPWHRHQIEGTTGF